MTRKRRVGLLAIGLLTLLGCGEGAPNTGGPPAGYPLVQCQIRITDTPTDLALEGYGFLAVGSGEQQRFVRGGHFLLSEDGFLVDTNGRRLQGFAASSWGIAPHPTLDNLTIFNSGESSPTSRVRISAHFDARAPLIDGIPFDPANGPATSNISSGVTVFGLASSTHEVGVWYRHETAGTWSWHATIRGEDVSGTPGTIVDVGTGTLTFGSSGNLVGGAVGSAFFNYLGSGGFKITFDHGGLARVPGGQAFGAAVQEDLPSGIDFIDQDGYTHASVTDVRVNQDGAVSAVFPGGSWRVVGYVPVIVFEHFDGLRSAGENSFRASPASGPPITVPPSQASLTLLSGAIEDVCMPDR